MQKVVRNLQTMAVLFVATLSLQACFHSTYTNTPKVAKTAKNQYFNRLEVRGPITVIYQQGKTADIKIIGKPKDTERIELNFDHNKLTIDSKNIISGAFFQDFDEDVIVKVNSPDLIGLTLSGSGDVLVEGVLDTDNLDITLRGSGDIDIQGVICDTVNCQLNGSGDIQIKKIDVLNSVYKLTGSGDLDVNQFNTQNTQVWLTGSGDINLYTKSGNVIDCKLVGSGDITLSGNIQKLNQSTKGSGEITTNNLHIGQP